MQKVIYFRLRQAMLAIPLSCILLLLAGFATNVTAHASGGGAITFIQTATSSNIVGSSTQLNNSGLNNDPNARIIATPDWNPGGSGGTYDNHPIAVNYASGYWYISNQDGAAMPVGAAFNIYSVSGTSLTGIEGYFSHTATAANSTSDYTILDDTSSLGSSSMRILVTVNTTGGVTDSHALGVFYLASQNKWAIFNQDETAIPVGTTFNIIFASSIVSDTLIHTATTANSAGDYTCINNSALNANPAALVTTTADWNPAGSAGTYNNHNTGVWYNNSLARWCIFNQDYAAVPAGAAFNIIFF